MSPIEHLTEQSFPDAAARPGLTAIDFWASWCGPCRVMAPQFERAAKLRPQYRFAKVDVDEQLVLAARFEIRPIPTLVVLRDGQPIAAQSDLIAADALLAALDRIAAADQSDRAQAA